MATEPGAPAKPAPSRKQAGVDKRAPTSRNLVVMLDGTSNEFGRNLSNVLKLFRVAEKGKRQLCFYTREGTLTSGCLQSKPSRCLVPASGGSN